MKQTLRDRVAIPIIILIFSSCASTKHIAYFQDISDNVKDTSELLSRPPVSPTIGPDDILLITVSGANPSAAEIFNQIPSGSSNAQYIGASTTTENLYGRASDMNLGYLVDSAGTINFPILGKLELGNLTLNQADDTLQNRLIPYLKDPLVNIRFLNYKITILGEVAHPGTYMIPNQQITLLQALGLAGDMTIFGTRVNLMVVREKNGKRHFGRINLNDSKSLFNSPFYYLQQNDVVYVEPRKSKLWNTDQAALRNVSIIATILSAISILATRF